MKLSLLLSMFLFVSSTSFAYQEPSISEASPEAKKAILRQLLVAVPAYLVESEKVLETIEKNAVVNKITDETKLSKTKIKGLFVPGQTQLAKILTETQFRSGRVDVNVAWLRQSVIELRKLNALVAQIYESQSGYEKLDSFFVNASYSQDEISEDVSLDILAISRPYCNLTISYSHMEDDMSVSTSEICD